MASAVVVCARVVASCLSSSKPGTVFRRLLARPDDKLENAWHKKVCSAKLTLRQARQAELAYKRAHG